MGNRVVASERRVSPARVAMVALGLVPVGAIAGAVAGVLGVTIWLSVAEGLRAAVDPLAWGIAGMVGGAIGALLLPIAGLTVLRYVPLGRALSETILATALGGAVGAQFLGQWWLAGPLLGFGLAATRLWALARRARAAGRLPSGMMLLILLALSASSCSKHPTYGRPLPQPRDSIPSDEPQPSSNEKPQEPGKVPTQ